MPTNVIMPQMGESIFEGTVTKWLKKPGDQIVRDEPLFEISTDKVDAEIPSPSAGVLTHVLVKEGETVQINTIVAVLDGDPNSVPPAAPSTSVGASAPAAAAPAAKPSAAAEVAVPIPAGPEPTNAPGGKGEVGASADDADGAGEMRSSPLVRKIAKEKGVDLALVAGSGAGGRISKQDVLDYVAAKERGETPKAPAARTAAAAPAAKVPLPAAPSYAPPPPPAAAAPVAATPARPAAPVAPAAPAISFTGPTRVEPMSTMRLKIAERMVQSKHTSPHVATVFQVDMTRIAKLRDKAKDSFLAQHGVKLTFTPFFVRAAAAALRAYPIVNSSLDGTNLVYKRDINIGIAVALEAGLIVPVIMHCEEKNFLGVARAIADLAERARTKKLLPDELANGTFTVTNPGNHGAMFNTPIINQPQVAIMGVGNVHKTPVVVTDEHGSDSIAIRTIVHLSLSFDHRVIDGAVADQFMAHVKKTLEGWNEQF